jgi:hypothetical protein
MSCYFRYLKEVFAEAGIQVTPATKRCLDEAIHALVGVPYKRCMPACWSRVKSAIQDASRRRSFIAALKRIH